MTNPGPTHPTPTHPTPTGPPSKAVGVQIDLRADDPMVRMFLRFLAEHVRGPIDNPLPRPTPPPPPKAGTNPHPSAPEPGPGQPPQPVPRGYTSAPFGHTGGRYGYMVLVGTGLMVGSGLAGVALQVVAR